MKYSMNIINLIGYASGSAANDEGCSLGPQYLLEHRKIFTEYELEPNWRFMEYFHSQHHGLDVIPDIGVSLGLLAKDVMKLVSEPSPFAVIGGDHSMAIATWHAIMEYYQATGPIGLIWVDAHMDSNTPQSSISKNPHGMPVSHLLGLWNHPALKKDVPQTILDPKHLCLIGIRSYEYPEYEFLSKLGVRIYFMEEVVARGLEVVLAEAFNTLYQRTEQIGMSIDLDAFDPSFCPGVGCRESHGINLPNFVQFFKQFYFKKWIGLEIAEFNPIHDQSDRTAKCIAQLIHSVYF
jgi:arginase